MYNFKACEPSANYVTVNNKTTTKLCQINVYFNELQGGYIFGFWRPLGQAGEKVQIDFAYKRPGCIGTAVVPKLFSSMTQNTDSTFASDPN